MYALNALTGAILWQTPIAASPDAYLWSSPVFYQATGQPDPSVYEGVADVGEPCPLVRGEVVQLDALTGQVLNTFFAAPAGCTGATVWGSLTVATDAVYAVTGNRGACGVANEQYSFAIVKLDARTLNVLDSWKIPKSERTNTDDDFGSVPILFSRIVSGQTQLLVGAPNKSGIFYIWDCNNLASGPLYRLTVANPRAADIAPASFDGTTLYIGSPATTVGGLKTAGSVRAFPVDTLPTPAWETPLTSPVLAAVISAPGIVVVGDGHRTVVLDANTGSVIASLQAALVGTKRGMFWSAPVIANGVLYEGDTNGILYAYSPGGL
jgi:outer membrane protein assembly factor BamB